jgi:uncharacterized protein YbjT (DUF2867 family)
MRTVRLGLQMVAVVAAALAVVACSTGSPGVKSTQFAQYTTLPAGPADATKAAEAVLKDLGLHEVTSSSTNVDGWAKGMMADKTAVNVSLTRVNDMSSDISVKVGSFGDPALGSDIISRVRKKLGVETPAASQPNH